MCEPNPWWFLPLVGLALLGTGGGIGYYLSRPSGEMTPEQLEAERRRREAEAHTQQLRIGLATEQMAPLAVVGILGAAGVGAFLLWKSREAD